MSNLISEIPGRILDLATGALAQANMHAAFSDPGLEHWDFISITNTAHAGELFLKAIIAKEHPLLIFRDLFGVDDGHSEQIDIKKLIAKGRTHDFNRLPQVLWAVTGDRIPNPNCYEALRKARNSIQHFCAPEDEDFRRLSLQFIYEIIDPLIRKHFNLFAIEYHEDHNIGYDYLVGTILRHQLKFSMPEDFEVGEISIREEVEGADQIYVDWLKCELSKVGKSKLFS